MVTSDQGAGAEPAPDPDARTLACRVCGRPFAGGVGWNPICRDCWGAARDQALIRGALELLQSHERRLEDLHERVSDLECGRVDGVT